METQPTDKGVLVLDIPVIHRGYVDLLRKHANGDIRTLYLVGEDLLASLEVPKEIRANDPETTKKLLSGLDLPFGVEILNLDRIGELTSQVIYTARDDVSKKLCERFFPDAQVTQESAFLRWDESNVASSRPALVDEETRDSFDVAMMKRAKELARDSSDWWRQVGAVIVKDGEILAEGYNRALPTDQKPYINGNPRDFIEAGTLAFLVGTIHAEQSAIAKSAAKKGPGLEGADIYVNIFPCPPCASSIGLSGINRCFWAGGNAYLDAAEVLRDTGVKSIFVRDN